MANFRTRARAVDLLGKQQIRDEITAISELLRNSYDADASEGLVDVSTKKNRIIIWDDGDGMSKTDILNNWLTLGTYSKKSKIVTKTKKGRIKIGEKGIGRLAISLLGDQLLLLTKKRNNNMKEHGKWVLLYLHWSLFRNENLFLEEIEIPVMEFDNFEELSFYLANDFQNIKDILLSNFKNKDVWEQDDYIEILKEIESFKVTSEISKKIHKLEKMGGGSLFYIDKIDNSWDWGSYNVDTKEENLERKKYRMKGLLLSFNNFIDLFEKQLADESVPIDDLNEREKNQKQGEIEVFTPKIHIDGVELGNKDALNQDDLRLFDYALKGEISNGEFFGEAFIGTSELPEIVKVESEKLTHGMIYNKALDYGPIKIKWFFVEGMDALSCIPKDQHRALTSKLDEVGGIYVFRDGLRILPYGEIDNDFLNVEKRRTIRAGTYLFSFRRMYGYIEIGKETNPNLVDKSSREGFIENVYYNYFRAILINLLIWWARDYLGTRSESSNGRRDNHISKSQIESTFRKKRDLEKKEEKKYFVKLEKWLGKFDESLKKIEQSCMNSIDRLLKMSLIDKSAVDNSNLEKVLSICRMELYKILESFEEEKWKLNNRYEHINETIEIIDEYNILIEETKTQLLKNTQTKIDDWLIKMQELLKSTYSSTDKKWINQQTNERIDWLTGTYFKNIVEIENERKKSINLYSNLIVSSVEIKIDEEIRDIKNFIFGPSDREIKLYIDELLALRNKLSNNNYSKDDILMSTQILGKYNSISLKIRQLLVDYQSTLSRSENFIEIEKMLRNFVELVKDEERWNYDEQLIGKMKTELTTYRDLSALGLATELTDHEFNSVYSKIKENLNQLTRALSKTSALPTITNTINAFKSLEKLHERMSPLYRQSRNRKKEIILKDYVQEILEFFQSDISRFDITIKNEIATDVIIMESEIVLFAPLVNLISNAIYWMLNQEKRELYFYASIDKASIFIHDSGPGINEKDYERVFDPFFSKKVEGRGLGLFLSRDILSSKGHTLTLIHRGDEQRSIKGACFSITFNSKSILGE